MKLLDRLRGLEASAEAEGSICVSPADADELGAVVRACRESPDPVMLEVDGLPPAPVWISESGEPDLRVKVDLTGLRGLSIHEEDHLVTAGAGLAVSDLEKTLTEKGLTLGFQETPDTPLGAWLAAGEPGPGASRAYPGWSPVAGLEAVLLEGSLIRTGSTPRSATGPDPKSLLVGGRGRLGVITRATLRVHPAEQSRRLVMAFADFAAAVGAAVEALGRDLLPDSFGLIDCGTGEAVLAWESRGEASKVARVCRAVDEICGLNGGRRVAMHTWAPGEDAVQTGALGAAGPVEVRSAASSQAEGSERPRMAVCLGARWSRLVLVRRALLNSLGNCVRLHLERALPEGALAIACVKPEDAEAARVAIREAGGHPVGDEDGDSWIEGVAGALLGRRR